MSQSKKETKVNHKVKKGDIDKGYEMILEQDKLPTFLSTSSWVWEKRGLFSTKKFKNYKR